MADANANAEEDAPVSSLHSRLTSEENDPSDETQDFRFLAAMSSHSGEKHQIPKRGEKDFEPHGTKYQDAILEASRKAMHDALDYTRVHVPKSNCRAWYFGDGVLEGNENEDDVQGVLSDPTRGRGLDRDHVVMVESSKGTHFRTMGKTALGLAQAKIWLLPEEALYLIERGNLDMWWPARPLSAVKGEVKDQGAEREEGDDADDGLPLSLEAAYALLIGEDEERGKVSLDKYTVYANLKRTGYVVFRVQNQDLTYGSGSQLLHPPGTNAAQKNLFTWLFDSFFSQTPFKHAPFGPLVEPGFYRSYNAIYRQLSVIPRHTPLPKVLSTPPEYPFRLVFDVWKPSRIPHFAKSNPGTPDFRIAIVTSRSTTVPSLMQLTSLLESSPWDPPPKDWTGPEKSYQRLKHGFRNVVLAVVDQGIISYLRLSEAAFGEEKLFERFDRGSMRGGKKSGGRGRGRGR